MDKVAALLLFASALGASVFMILAQKEHLFAAANDFPANPNSSFGSEIVYSAPSDSRSINGSDTPFFDAAGKGGDSSLYEKRISESEYAFLEDKRQLERRD